jgi:hypothetical protein
MRIEEIEVVIDADGNVQIKTHGLKGKACLEATQKLEAALGGDIRQREMTAESYEQEVVADERVTTRT